MSTTAANQIRAAALKAARAKDSELKRRAHASRAETLETSGAAITFTAVAKAAGVSTWLVYADGIREHIDAARHRQSNHHRRTDTPTASSTHPATLASLRADLAIAREQIKTLRTERDKLQQRLRLQLGAELEAPDRAHLTARVVDLETINRQLVAERDARAIEAQHRQRSGHRTRRRAIRRTRKPAPGHQSPKPRTMTHTFAATPARSRTLPRASRAPHSKNPLTSNFSEKIQITFGHRLINRDVPQEVVRRPLDHESPQMTAHYARITDKTVRRRWEAARQGRHQRRESHFRPGRPARASRMGQDPLGLATQALPNGYCGLPLQRTCPHANACLTCPVFLTGPEFLPELREQRHRTLTLIDVSRSNGHAACWR